MCNNLENKVSTGNLVNYYQILSTYETAQAQPRR
jgi:hypothetical protein